MSAACEHFDFVAEARNKNGVGSFDMKTFVREKLKNRAAMIESLNCAGVCIREDIARSIERGEVAKLSQKREFQSSVKMRVHAHEEKRREVDSISDAMRSIFNCQRASGVCLHHQPRPRFRRSHPFHQSRLLRQNHRCLTSRYRYHFRRLGQCQFRHYCCRRCQNRPPSPHQRCRLRPPKPRSRQWLHSRWRK